MKLLLTVLSLVAGFILQAQIITTVAGTGTFGHSGDGGPATSAQLNDLYYTFPAFDSKGNMYFGQGNNTIRKVSADGIITTIAGTPDVIGSSGDGGLASKALLYHPTAIAIDKDDNIYFADGNGSVIRKIDFNGIITTVSSSNAIGCGEGDGKPLSEARFQAISSLTIGPNNNLYISDYGCNTIRMVNSAGIVSTIAGNGTWGFSGDNGPALSAQMSYPCKVAVDNAGNIYISDAQNHRIRKVDATTGIITTVMGTGIMGDSGDGGPATAAKISYPGSVVIDKAGNIYVGDHNFKIRKVDPSGMITTYAGTGPGYTGDGGPAIDAKIYMTEARISIDHNDNIYFSDALHRVIRKISNCLSPIVSLQPNSLSTCAPGTIELSINATHASSYVWQENKGTGWNDLSESSTYSGTTSTTLHITGANGPMNGYQYRTKLVNSCGAAYSIPVTLTVNTPAPAAVSITSSASTICAGSPLTFTATPINGGDAPVFQWKKNGVNVGSNSSSYTATDLKDGDKITCFLLSNSTCITSKTASSNTIIVNVTPTTLPAVTITATKTQICAGNEVTFEAFATNEGSTPTYHWKKNSLIVGANNKLFIDQTLADGDIISCELISNAACISIGNATSNLIAMKVNPVVTPSIQITSSKNAVCPGESNQFTAAISNGGTTPIYQWKLNGVNIGTNSSTLSLPTPAQGDVLTCRLTSNASCVTTTTVVSNSQAITVYPEPEVRLDKTPSICTGDVRILDAGNFPDYKWSNGSTSKSITVQHKGTYSVIVTDNNGCKGFDTTVITTLLPKPSAFLAIDTAICSYGSLELKSLKPFRQYSWSNSSSSPSITITQAGTYWLDATDANNCTGRDTILVRTKECLRGLFVPSAFTPNKDGKNDVLKAMLFGDIENYEFVIYNRWGELVFKTTDISKGWDGSKGGRAQDNGVFIWLCNYQLAGQPKRQEKGTVALIK
jgi:gliding motility-associated-like protein